MINITGVCNVHFPNRLERVKIGYDGSDLQAFLDDHAEWFEGAMPVTAVEIESKLAEYDESVADSQSIAFIDSQDIASTKGDALIKEFLDRGPSGIAAHIDSKTTLPGLKQVVKLMARILWLMAYKEFK